MIPPCIQPYIMYENESAYKAYYNLASAHIFPIVLVVDNDGKLAGVLTMGEFLPFGSTRLINLSDTTTVGEVCNKNYFSLNESQDIYLQGRNLFAEHNIKIIPIVSETGEPVRLFARWQAFFREHLEDGKLHYPYYADCIWRAANYAKYKGYERISVLEFGVAGGRGLIRAELYAIEIERLVGIKIDVYGFDSGVGLLVSNEHKDMLWHFSPGEYEMDIEALLSRLQKAKIVIGDICDTSKTFLSVYQPAPIGAMFIDVDTYSPTLAALNMLLGDDDYFLPIIAMYFDDVSADYQFQGEWQAVSEFNEKSEFIKISPNDPLLNHNIKWKEGTQWWASKLKQCYRFNHNRFTRSDVNKRQLPLPL